MSVIRRTWGAWAGILLLAGCGQESSPLDRAQGHYRAAQWDRAITACDDQLRLEPESSEAVLLRGRARMAAGQPQAAVADFAEVIRLAPSNPEGFYQRSLAYEALGNSKEAAADLEHARAIDLQDVALLRRHTATLQTTQPVRSEPAKQEAELKFSTLADDPPNYLEKPQARDSAEEENPDLDENKLESPLLAPVLGPVLGSLSNPPLIIGGKSLLDSPILNSPVVPRPAKTASPISPFATSQPAAEETEPSKPAPPSAAQSAKAWSPRNFGPGVIQSDGSSPSTRHSSNAHETELEDGSQVPSARQSKYPVARLNFISSYGPKTASRGTGRTRMQRPSLQPDSLQPDSLQPPSTLVQLGLASPPQDRLTSADSEDADPNDPLLLEPQVRGFSPYVPPLYLSMPSEPGQPRAFEPLVPIPTRDPHEIPTISADRKMPAPRKAPPPPKLPLDD